MSHNTGPIIELPSTIPTEAVDDFLIVQQDDPTRPATYVSGDLYTQLATTRETDFNFNVFDFFMPVGGGAPPHVHSFDDEIWFVADGDIQYNLGPSGTDTLVVPEGGVVFGPINRTHGFLNLNSTASISGVTPGARAISMTAPGLLDLFFLAGGTQVEERDRDEPVPDPDDSTDQGFIDIAATIKFGVRTNSLISFIGPGLEEYEPPEDALDYLIVLPEDAKGKVVKQALELTKLDGFSIWTTGDHAGLPQRPTFTGKFGIEYTSLVNREESRNEFSYNQFSLEPQDPSTGDSFPDSAIAYNHKFYYVNEGHLTLKVGDEIRVVEEDTFAYVAPGNEFSIANFGDETVESLAVTVFDKDSPFPTANELFPSPLNPQDGSLPNEVIFLGDGADFFGGSGEGQENRRVYGGGANDELFAIGEDRLFGEMGNDLLDASLGKGGNRLYGGKGKDEILVNFEDRAFGGDGADLLDASSSKGRHGEGGHNLLNGGNGGDFLVAGSNDQLVGGKGDDILNIGQGGDNLLYGGSGADEFRIANGSLPATVEVEYSEEITSSLPDGLLLPDLVDTRNTVMDFKLGVDKIHILGLENIASSFDDLELLPAFGDLGSTSIVADFKENGIEKEISLANVANIIFTELNTNDFIFA